jgi:hypothetical protein
MEKVQARWVGTYAGVMRETGRSLDPGSVHEVYPHEAYGQTLLVDPLDASHVELIGVGHVAKAEHAGLSRAALEQIGYRFEEKSANWEPVEPFDSAQFRAAPEPQPAEVDLSAFFVTDAEAEAQRQASLTPPPDDPEAVEAGAVVEAHKADDGTITITTTSLEPDEPAEPEAQASEA